jgi:hypothetical protein
MEQMHIDPAAIVEAELDGPAELLKPVVFKEGNGFCALLGHDPETGVFGCGETAELAVTDWNERLKIHLAEHGEDDYIVQYVRHLVGVKPMHPQLQVFYDHLRSLKGN